MGAEMTELELRCRCGAIRGSAQACNARSVLRLACYCDDCQAFARALGAESAMDAWGGTEVLQMTPSQFRIEQGQEHLGVLRLKPKGLYRWYSRCCHTPIANTVNASLPFVSVVRSFVADAQDLDDAVGPVRFRVMGQHALGPPAELNLAHGFPRRLLALMVPRMLWAKLTGKSRPNVLFGEDGRPCAKPIAVDQLGPVPSAAGAE